ncbi:SirB2 family protein [Microbacterium sp. 4R-513]|uniref:SirB2 family protein n=1 Tax=Microbacterium sp. 4R-513 TaxID=2567934 RepID=UPI0013E1B716|nr:SirB2 family protein [Microbacterium sp. 4R-513]QIG39883.1 SirB2 family protein [Microbacterium sp. 4R-513]
MSDPTAPENRDAAGDAPLSDPTVPENRDAFADAPLSDPTAPAAPATPAGSPAGPADPAAPSEPAASAGSAAPAYSAPVAPGGPQHDAYAAPGYPGAPQPPFPAGQPYGAAGQPYGTAGQPYDAAGQAYPAPGQPYGAPAATAVKTPDTRPKVLAIIGLAAAGLGLILAFIPFVTWFSGIFLLAGFVLGLIALISKKQGGKGFAIGALAVAVVGWIVSIVVSIASFGIIAQAAIDEGRASQVSGGQAVEEEADEPAAEGAAGDAEELVATETAFGRDEVTGSWWYVVILDNPNADYVYDFAAIDVEAVDASGTILDTSNNYVTLLSGQSAITGTFFDVGQGEVAKLDVRVPDAGDAVSSPADETGTFAIEGVAATSDEYSTSVSGTIAGTFQDEQELVQVIVVARAADGSIIGGQQTYVERLPADGTKVQFEATFFDPLPADATFEAYASL